MGLKNNLELLGRFISRGTFNQMFFFVSGPEMSVHLDGLINGGVGAYRHQFTLAVL